MTKHSQPVAPPNGNGQPAAVMNQQERVQHINDEMNALMQRLRFTIEPTIAVTSVGGATLTAIANIQIRLLE